MRVLVIGGAGFIGNHLVKELSKNQVTVFDMKKPKEDVEYEKISILEDSLEKRIEAGEFDCMVNLAAVKTNQKNLDEFMINSFGAAKIFNIARNLEIPLVHLSSTAVYGKFVIVPANEEHPLNPISLYGYSKLLGEDIGRKLINGSNVPCTIFRPTIVYGPGGSDVITTFIRKSLKKEPVTLINNGKYKRDFLFVKDLVDVIGLAIRKKISGIFNVGTGKEYTIKKTALLIKKFIPNMKIKNVRGTDRDVDQGAVDIRKVKEEFKFEPKYTLERGIKETVDWYKL